MILRIASALALISAVWVFWQPLLSWIQSLLLVTMALLCWRVAGKDENGGQ